MIDPNSCQCDNPQLIFDRSSIRKIVENGNYTLCGRRYTLLRTPYDFVSHFDYDKFNPYRNNLVHIHTLKNGDQRFVINYEMVNKCYTENEHTGEITYLFILVPCGTCVLCRHSKASSTVARLQMEADLWENPPLFVTLTYANKFLPLNGVRKAHVQNFMKRLRNLFDEPLRYFAVSEYGKNDTYTDKKGRLRRGTARPHYHLLIFGAKYNPNLPRELASVVNRVERAWRSDGRKHDSEPYGMTKTIPCDSGAFKYVCKYMVKTNKVPKKCKSNFRLMSRRPGLGYDFIIRNNLREWFIAHSNHSYMHRFADGSVKSLQLPKYIVNKMFPTFSMQVPTELRLAFDGVNYFLKKLADNGYYVRPLYEYFASFIGKYSPLGYRLRPCPVRSRNARPFYYTKVKEIYERPICKIKDDVLESLEYLQRASDVFEKYKSIDVDDIFENIRQRSVLYSFMMSSIPKIDKLDRKYKLDKMYDVHLAKSQF